MPELIYVFDPFPDREHYISILDEHGFNVKVFQTEDELFENLKKLPPHLLISELKVDKLDSYLNTINIFLKKNYFPHMSVTSNRNIYDISLAETYAVRPIILKPASYEHLAQTVKYKILNKNNGIVICEEKDKRFFEKCFATQGFKVATISRTFEVPKTLYARKWDFVIYIDGNEDFTSKSVLNKFISLGFEKLPIYFFMKQRDYWLENILQKYPLCRIQLYPWDFELAEEHLIDLIIKSCAKKKPEIKIETPKEEIKATEKESQINKDQIVKNEKNSADEVSLEDSGEINASLVKDAEKPTEKIDKKTETETGKYSLQNFVDDMEYQIKDQMLYRSLKNFINSESDFQRKKCIEGFSDKSIYYPYFHKAYTEGNDALREIIVSLLADFKKDEFIESLLINALNDKLPSIQFLAMQGLALSANDKVYTLIKELLSSKEEKIRKSAFRILCDTKKGTFFTDLLITVISNEDFSMTKNFIRYLDNIYPRIKQLTYFLPVFSSKYDFLKEELMELFYQKKDKRIIDIVDGILANSPANIFKIALNMLADYAKVEVIPILLKYIEGKHASYVEETLYKILEQNIHSKNIDYFKKVMVSYSEEYKEKLLDLVKLLKEKDQYDLMIYAMSINSISIRACAMDICAEWKNLEMKAYAAGPLIGSEDRIISDYAYNMLSKESDKSCIEPLLRAFIQIDEDYPKERIAEILASIVADHNPSALSKLIGSDSYSKIIDILKAYGVSLGKFTTAILGDKIKNTDSFELIIKTLYEPDVEARAEAAFILGEQKLTEAVPHLTKFIDDENWYVRKVVVEALGKIGDTSSFKSIIKLMSDENSPVRYEACSTLVSFNVQFRENIMPLIMKEDSVKVLDKMILLLAPFRDPKTAQRYLPQLSSTSPMTKIQAAVVLLSLWNEPNLDIIRSWLKSDNWSVRLLAISFFSSQNPEMIINEMEVFIMDKSEEVRKFLVHFMSTTNKDIETLISFLEKFAVDESLLVRIEVLHSLKDIKDKRSLNIAKNMFKTEKEQSALIELLDLFDQYTDNEIPHLLFTRYNDFSDYMQKKTEVIIRKYESKEF